MSTPSTTAADKRPLDLAGPIGAVLLGCALVAGVVLVVAVPAGQAYTGHLRAVLYLLLLLLATGIGAAFWLYLVLSDQHRRIEDQHAHQLELARAALAEDRRDLVKVGQALAAATRSTMRTLRHGDEWLDALRAVADRAGVDVVVTGAEDDSEPA